MKFSSSLPFDALSSATLQSPMPLHDTALSLKLVLGHALFAQRLLHRRGQAAAAANTRP